ncbi:transglycosylase SLT domain-containing protein [Ideonella sp. DXS22W]|uniref:Transglycosylase SLT domain-containing protein n=1 Tax=Pseudaquabacterium inlustre TaxID=2984192 RepID=A0ABU9CEV7_9BURK
MNPPHARAPRAKANPPALPWLPRALALAAASLLAACATPGGQPAAGTESQSAALPLKAVAPATPSALFLAANANNTGPAAAATGASGASAASASATAATAAASDASAPIAIDPLEPTARINLDDVAAQTDLWARVRRGLALPDLETDHVRKWEQWYAARPDYVQRMTDRGSRYLFHVVEEVNRRGLPTELALLPFIESAFNPQAMSSAKASGMWQFVPGTGRDFALKQNVFRDDRRSVLDSTRAALDYLQTLHGMFGDWQLALAAYNWGQGNVQRAIARNQKAGLATDYLSLSMPDETRNYLPKLQAVKNIVSRPDAYGLTLPELRNHPYFISVGIDRDIDLERAAQLAGLPLDEFKALNPQMNKPVILAAGTPQVLLPYDNANRFVRALQSAQGPLSHWTAWVAPRTLKTAEAAKLVGMDEEQLRQVNAIPPRMLVKAGSTLLVPRQAHRTEDVAEHIADNATLALAPDLPPLRRVTLKAGKRGESVAAIAARYRVSPAQVAQWNPGTTANGQFKAGQSIVVMLPNRAAAASTAVAAASQGGARVAAKAKAPGVRMAARASTGKRIQKPGPTARSRVPQT